MALALSGNFTKVVGADVSENALNDGAYALQKELQKRSTTKATTPTNLDSILEFRCGNGLQPLNTNEVDAVCIAGMGVNTMLKILLHEKELERVNCSQLILQPTNSRPRNLMVLYDSLLERGWKVAGERIEYQAKRWYLSTSFVVVVANQDQSQSPSAALPGDLLDNLPAHEEMNQVYSDYVAHHKRWLERDSKEWGELRDENDRRWLETINNNR